MRAIEPSRRERLGSRRAARFDLAFRAALVAVLWAILRVLGGDLTSFVSVAVLAAIFGPDAVRAGRGWVSQNIDDR